MTSVKVCGIRRLEDAQLAVELGARALGFVFWPSSPRFIDPDEAGEIIAGVTPFVVTVGVFVNQSPECVSDIARRARLDFVQLHGDENVTDFMPWRLLKAISVADADDAEARVAALGRDVIVLLDAHDPVKRGGTGRTIDWTRAAAIAQQRPVVLSGGLNADNVREAIDIVRPLGVDVSSGVEIEPGVKDPVRMRRFFEAVGR